MSKRTEKCWHVLHATSSTCFYEIFDDILSTNVYLIHQNMHMESLAVHTSLIQEKKCTCLACVLKKYRNISETISLLFYLVKNGLCAAKSVNYYPSFCSFIHFTLLFKNISVSVKYTFTSSADPFLTLWSLIEFLSHTSWVCPTVPSPENHLEGFHISVQAISTVLAAKKCHLYSSRSPWKQIVTLRTSCLKVNQLLFIYYYVILFF